MSKIGVGFGVMLLKDNKILLGKRHDDPEKADSELHGEGTWTMPGGGLHFGENLEDAAFREVSEETGIMINKDSLGFISLSNDKVEDAHFITMGFLCEDFAGEAEVKEPDEITEWQWFALDDLPAPLFICTERLLENYFAQRIYTRFPAK
jgi:ADP-ribose pyrophosphatase YjhB (NUDIX family)